jgi:hypothetical protein
MSLLLCDGAHECHCARQPPAELPSFAHGILDRRLHYTLAEEPIRRGVGEITDSLRTNILVNEDLCHQKFSGQRVSELGMELLRRQAAPR